MKILALMVLSCNLVYADQSADSFATGFANGLQRAIEHQQGYGSSTAPSYQPYQAPQPVYVTPVYPGSAGHYDIRDNYGNMSSMNFPTYTSCIEYAGADRQCVWLEQ